MTRTAALLAAGALLVTVTGTSAAAAEPRAADRPGANTPIQPAEDGVQPGAAARASCTTDVWYVGARGSGESASGFHGMGASVDRMAGPVEKRAQDLGLTFKRKAVDYPADSVSDLVPSPRQVALALVGRLDLALVLYKRNNLDRYNKSIAKGISASLETVRDVVSRCPNAQIVMAGYSQGAIAVHVAQNRMEAKDDPALDNVVGTLLLGDGDRVPGSKAKRFGSSPARDEGIRPYLRLVDDKDVAKPGSTASICNNNDVVCDFGLHVLRHPGTAVSTHTTYAEPGKGRYDPILKEAATWVATKISSPKIRFDGSPLDGPPPATLGPYAMTPFGADPQPFDPVQSVVDPAGTLTFEDPVQHVRVGDGWQTWSHGYSGDVYYSLDDVNSITIELPSDTKAFYLYAEPNQFADYDIHAETGNGTSSGMQTVYGNSGASYFGFYATGANHLGEITVHASDIIAVGEFGIYRG